MDPCLGPGADSFLYRRPKFLLLRCQLQRRLGHTNSRIGQDVELGWGQPRVGSFLRIYRAGNDEDRCQSNYSF